MPVLELPGWRGVVKSKCLIFDADALISIIEFKATKILENLKDLGVTFAYINPVMLELMNADKETKRLDRVSLLRQYDFVQLPMREQEIQMAQSIQSMLPIGIKGRPSPTDYYLGGVLARY